MGTRSRLLLVGRRTRVSSRAWATAASRASWSTAGTRASSGHGRRRALASHFFRHGRRRSLARSPHGHLFLSTGFMAGTRFSSTQAWPVGGYSRLCLTGMIAAGTRVSSSWARPTAGSRISFSRHGHSRLTGTHGLASHSHGMADGFYSGLILEKFRRRALASFSHGHGRRLIISYND